MTSKPAHFLALGDSYTIGEGLPFSQSWPLRLTEMLRDQGLALADPTIIAQTGWTTDELLVAIQEQNPQGQFNLVTLLIGVNNQYRGGDLETYRAEFRLLLEDALRFAGGNPSRVVVISIPDWGVTPFAEGRDRAQIAAQIDQYNLVNQQESQSAGVGYVDVTKISRQEGCAKDWLAPDGLHPSGKMYTSWIELILPLAQEILETEHPYGNRYAIFN